MDAHASADNDLQMDEAPPQPPMPDAAYFETRHPDLTPSMRWVLVDWLMELSSGALPLSQTTLCLSINLVDRFLSQTTGIVRTQLQLIGSVCLMLAAKLTESEVACPLLSDMEHFCDYTYSVDQLRKMEATVVRQVGFELGVTAAEVMETLIAKAAPRDQQLARMLLDLSQLSLISLQRPPAILAQSIYHLAVPSAPPLPTTEPGVLDTMQDLRAVYKHVLHSLKTNASMAAPAASPVPSTPTSVGSPMSIASSTVQNRDSQSSSPDYRAAAAGEDSLASWPSPRSPGITTTPVNRKRPRADKQQDDEGPHESVSCLVEEHDDNGGDNDRKRPRLDEEEEPPSHLQLDGCNPAVCGAATVFRKYWNCLGSDVADWPLLAPPR
jgi:hypothetical protein